MGFFYFKRQGRGETKEVWEIGEIGHSEKLPNRIKVIGIQ
jgi:hypothetical protein